MGLADGSVEPDFVKTHSQFVSLTEAYSVPKQCYCFEMRADQKDPDIETFKPIPEGHLTHHFKILLFNESLSTLFNNWGAMMKQDFESLANAAIKAKRVPATILDIETDSTRQQKRKTLARLRKQLGDYCLLAGVPSDAIEQYVIQMAKDSYM